MHGFVESREFVLLPLAGLAVAGLAIAFEAITDHSVNDVLFSGESALPGLVSGAGTWSVSALLLVIVFKGLAWTISLGSFRGGPIFPALFLGAAAGLAVPTWRASTRPLRWPLAWVLPPRPPSACRCRRS